MRKRRQWKGVLPNPNKAESLEADENIIMLRDMVVEFPTSAFALSIRDRLVVEFRPLPRIFEKINVEKKSFSYLHTSPQLVSIIAVCPF